MVSGREHLEKVSRDFVRDTFFVPVIGAELEFYFVGEVPDDVLQRIAKDCYEAGLEICDVKEEEGRGQFEVSLLHVADPVLLADGLCKTKVVLEELAESLGVEVDFSAKPMMDDHGSALHVHISLVDENGKNVLQKEGENECLLMHYAVGGLLDKMHEHMRFFVPSEMCLKRFVEGKNVPLTVSWGGNNRTVALRLPTTTADPYNRRIEHRVPSACADPYMVVACILEGVMFGVLQQVEPSCDKIYGDATLEMYGLERILG